MNVIQTKGLIITWRG